MADLGFAGVDGSPKPILSAECGFAGEDGPSQSDLDLVFYRQNQGGRDLSAK